MWYPIPESHVKKENYHVAAHTCIDEVKCVHLLIWETMGNSPPYISNIIHACMWQPSQHFLAMNTFNQGLPFCLQLAHVHACALC